MTESIGNSPSPARDFGGDPKEQETKEKQRLVDLYLPSMQKIAAELSAVKFADATSCRATFDLRAPLIKVNFPSATGEPHEYIPNFELQINKDGGAILYSVINQGETLEKIDGAEFTNASEIDPEALALIIRQYLDAPNTGR
jgi:hypothetical protein